MKKIIKNIEEMKLFSEQIAKNLSSNKKKEATILLLEGNLGSGKTTFARFFIASFGIKQPVTSPTFVIEKIYKLPQKSKFKNIIHIDAYRLEKGEDLIELDWEKNILNPHNIILIEWPEVVSSFLPKDSKLIKFKFLNENKREVVFNFKLKR